MNEKNLYILLSIINKNSSVSKLTREGLTFPKIAELAKHAISINLVVHKDDKIKLSEAGLNMLNKLEEKHRVTDKEKWIEKELKSIIPKLDEDSIFLPNQNNLTF